MDEPCKYFGNSENYVYFGQGHFDRHCVFLKLQTQAAYAPKDAEYFEFFRRQAVTYGRDKIYRDFVAIYNRTGRITSHETFDFITAIAATYAASDRFDFDVWFTVIYMGMIAEENKQNTKLGKRIKRLGMHQILYDGLTPGEAAVYSMGKDWRFLAKECANRNF